MEAFFNQFLFLLEISTVLQIHLGSSNLLAEIQTFTSWGNLTTAEEQSPEQVTKGWACAMEAPRSLFPFHCWFFDVTNTTLMNLFSWS